MFSRKLDGPLTVQVPSAAQDRPPWRRVAIVATAAFLVGVGWPRWTGVRAGAGPDAPSGSAAATASGAPVAPGAPQRADRPVANDLAATPPPAGTPPPRTTPEAPPAAAGLSGAGAGAGAPASPAGSQPPAESAAPSQAAASPPSAAPAVLAVTEPPAVSAATAAPQRPEPPAAEQPSAPGASPPPPGPATPAGPPAVNVSTGAILSCKNAGGDLLKSADCGKVTALDAVVARRLRRLADCPDAVDAAGKLSLVLHVDFPHGLLGVELGRAHTVRPAEALAMCARSDVNGAPLASIPHDFPRYTVAYTVSFTPGARAAAPPPPAPVAAARPAGEAANDEAPIAWDVGLVRDAPKTGKILARLPRGSLVRLGPVRDGWYPVRYGEGFTSEGWLYRGALGR
ncbi:MAG: hypothetical protein JOZ69_09255 [Myxococcales bacterium]|nr:hypothetical protein [Myxococcales bacterium]